MITAVNSCGCAPKFSAPQVSPPRTPTPRPSRPRRRQPFENPRLRVSREDEAKCPCPRDGQVKHESIRGQCSPCCEGVFPDSKIVSKIIQGGKPYKEIEAVINDNRMVIRIQRESLKSEWDPPCDCADDFGDGQTRLGGGGCGNNVVFQKSDDRAGKESRGGCRTVTVFPQPEVVAHEPRDDLDNERKEKKDKCEKIRTARLEDIEDNPNIFLLRIRKRSEKSDRKNNIDLEFRTPRPWINKPKPNVVPTEPDQTPPKSVVQEKKSTKGKGAGKKKKGKKK